MQKPWISEMCEREGTPGCEDGTMHATRTHDKYLVGFFFTYKNIILRLPFSFKYFYEISYGKPIK